MAHIEEKEFFEVLYIYDVFAFRTDIFLETEGNAKKVNTGSAVFVAALRLQIFPQNFKACPVWNRSKHLEAISLSNLLKPSKVSAVHLILNGCPQKLKVRMFTILV